MSKNQILSLCLCLFFMGMVLQNSLFACSITMGYRSNERLPLINKAPDNSGLYYDLYRHAAEQLGCQLKVLRGSKKRILKMLKKGIVDFYPGFNFTPERAKYTYYIENGLPGGDIGISRRDMPNITDINQLEGYTLLAALGAPQFVRQNPQINVHKVAEMTVDKAIAMINLKRGDFYIYNKSTLDFYLNKNDIKSIKVHPDCCGGVKPLYLGFSRKSEHLQERENPDYDPEKAAGVDNFPSLIEEKSLVYQLQRVLKEMKESGHTQRLYERYYN